MLKKKGGAMFNVVWNRMAVIDNVEEFDVDLIEAAKRNGFCYIRIPKETSFTQRHSMILSKSRYLFNSPDNVKKTY